MSYENYKNSLRIPKNKGILGQEIFFIKNTNFIWSLHNTNNKLLGRYSVDEGNTFTQWLEIVDDYDGYFSFAVTEENILHISCKNTSGNLVYALWDKNHIATDILAEKYVEEEVITYQTLIVDGNNTPHLIYFTDNSLDKIWKIKYCFKDTKWNLPVILDTGIGASQNQGAAALSPDNSVHLIYQKHQKSTYKLIHLEKKLKENWSEKKVFSVSKENNFYPSLVVDEENTLHLTWVKSDGMNYRVIYKRKNKGGWMVGGWKKDIIISPEGVNAYSPTIGIINEKIMIIWQQVDGIYHSDSLDEGESFSDAILQKQYDNFLCKNIIPLDLYKKHGLNAMTSFDTGSTAIALLATVFQNDQENINLPELNKTENLILPNMDYLSIDYGQRGLQKHISEINGNFQRLFFETEDTKLTNNQMRKTIQEKTETIENLNMKILEKEKMEIAYKETEKQLKDLIRSLQNNLTQSQTDFQGKENILEKTLTSLEENKVYLEKIVNKLKKDNLNLQEKVAENEHINTTLSQLISEKEAMISALENNEENLKKELNDFKTAPLWKKIITKS